MDMPFWCCCGFCILDRLQIPQDLSFTECLLCACLLCAVPLCTEVKGKQGQIMGSCLQLLLARRSLRWWGRCQSAAGYSRAIGMKYWGPSSLCSSLVALVPAGSQSGHTQPWLYPHFTPLFVSVFEKQRIFCELTHQMCPFLITSGKLLALALLL